MNRGGAAPSSGFSRFLVRVDRRRRLGRALRFACWALLPSVAALVFGLLLRRPLPAVIASGIVAGVGLAWAGLAAGRRDLARAASAADRHAGLLDLLKTTLEVETQESGTPWRAFLARRAESAVAGVEPATVAPVRPPRPALAAAGLGLLVAVVLAVRPELVGLVWPRGATGDASSTTGGALEEAGDAAAEGLDATAQPEPGDTQQPGADRPVAPPGSEPGMPIGEADSLEAARGSVRADPSTRRTVDEPASGDRSAASEAASGAEAPATLRDERRRQGGDDASARRDRPGAETGERGDGAEPSDGEEGEPGSPARREVADQVVAFDLPSPDAARNERGDASETAGQAAAAGGQRQAALGEARNEVAESGAAGAGLGTAAQESSTPLLGVATELAVTLEEVLLSARSDEQETERRTRPSRRAENAAPAATPSDRPLGARAPEQERPALSLPYPLRERELVREFFAPRPDPTPADAATEDVSG